MIQQIIRSKYAKIIADKSTLSLWLHRKWIQWWFSLNEPTYPSKKKKKCCRCIGISIALQFFSTENVMRLRWNFIYFFALLAFLVTMGKFVINAFRSCIACSFMEYLFFQFCFQSNIRFSHEQLQRDKLLLIAITKKKKHTQSDIKVMNSLSLNEILFERRQCSDTVM